MIKPKNFYSKVLKTKTCWIWTGSKNKKGYGLIGDCIGGGKSITKRAHRVIWVWKNGPIPDGFIVRHICDNPSCVNPDHLEIGTYKDNTKDMLKRGRASRHTAKLTDKDIKFIRKAYIPYKNSEKLAAIFGVCSRQIRKIANKEQWKT
jgi:hypothetical protein